MPLDLSNTPDDITKRHEDQLHTYTPLFSPPTPRASPSPGEQAKEESRRRRSYRANYGDALGIGGGSGIGVIVPDMQDPLSIPVSFTHGGEHGEKNHGNTDTDADSMGATGNANSTLAFFDKFVSEARAASEMNRRSVLDEILLHQDDPLFRWSRSDSDDQVAASGDEALPQEEIQNTETADEPGPCPVPERLEAGELAESPTHTPKRSPTLSSLQSTLAPPLESTDTANAATNTVHPPLGSSSYFPDSSTRSPYATLSGLHSRWVSSRLHHNNTGNTNILSSSSSPPNTYMPSDFTSASSTTSTSTTKPSTPRTITRPHTSTNSNPDTNTRANAHVRSSSFGSSSLHSPSPFASHMSVPISGAPGFVDERYNWDRGFSDELIKELEDVGHTNTVEEWRVVKTESDKDKGDTADTRRVFKLKSTRETRGTTQAKENLANGTTRILGKTQLTQTLIAGSGVSRISKKDKDSAMKRVRGASSIAVVSSGPSGSLGGGGGPLSIKNHEKFWSETLERGKGNGNSNEERHDGRLVSELIEKKLGSVELKGRKEITTPVLDVMLADSLRTHLPALDRLPKSWNLVYSLDQHGISLNTLYTRCEAHTQAQTQSQVRLGSGGSKMIGSGAGIGRPGMIVVVKDSGDSVFGVWIGDGLRQSRGKGYYGSGESFMWRYRNVERNEKDLDVYKWTGRNKYVVLGEPDYISFGGGEGKYGLYLDETLFEGSSARCPTFDNEPLCSPGANKAGAVAFECVGLEVWGIGP